MALFTDGQISSANDLREYDASVLSDANAESIDVAAKVRLAQLEIAHEVMLFLRRRAAFRDYLPNYQRSHELTDIVVTDALRQWHIHKTLELVYRDAYNTQLNDRYQGKWNQYEQLAKESGRLYFRLGVGVVADPVPRTAAPLLTSVSGTGSGSTFYAAATVVNSAGEEGAPSDLAELTTSLGQDLAVSLSNAPPNMSGWNAYVGLSPSGVTLQNDSPLAIGSAWIMSGGLSTGATLPSGQKPKWFIVDHNTIERG